MVEDGVGGEVTVGSTVVGRMYQTGLSVSSLFTLHPSLFTLLPGRYDRRRLAEKKERKKRKEGGKDEGMLRKARGCWLTLSGVSGRTAISLYRPAGGFARH